MITIIGILIALLLPAVQAAREAARRLQCGNNFRQTALGVLNYESQIGMLPPGGIVYGESPVTPNCCPIPPGKTKYCGPGWSVAILPQMEQQAVYDNFHWNIDFWNYSPQQWALSLPKEDQRPISVRTTSATRNWRCSPCRTTRPRRRGANEHRRRVGHDRLDVRLRLAEGVPAEQRALRARNRLQDRGDVKDGMSHTLMLAEVTGAGPGTRMGFVWVSSCNMIDVADGINGDRIRFPAEAPTRTPRAP